MPFRRRPARKKPKRYQRQNTKRNTKSMQKYGENYKQNPRLILNTIQPANYVAQSVTIRHTYDNTINLVNLQFSRDSQDNYHINFVPNALTIFQDGGSLSSNANVTYGRTVVDVHNNTAGQDGGTTVLDDTLSGANWASRYKKAQVMSTHYNFNVRQIDGTTSSALPEGKKMVPLVISAIRAHQQGVIDNTANIEKIQKLAFTQTRFLGKGRSDYSGRVNLKVAHFPARFNGQQKNYVNNPEYCITTGASIQSAKRMLPGEKDFLTLAVSPASSALDVDNAVTGNLLIRMRVSSIVKYCEPAIQFNEPIPNTGTVIMDNV